MKKKLIPVMLCFFAMGFVDLVGIASNYVKADLGLTDAQANIFPSLVFFWFLIFSVPTGMLMNRIGRRKTVLISLIITVVSLLLPLFGETFPLMLVSFSLLGIGNALMQTSLNPLLSNIVSGDKLASNLTFGQFVKAIASFMAPYIAMWGAVHAIPEFGLGWRVLFPIYMIIAIAAVFWLGSVKIEEEPQDKASGFIDSISLLAKPFVLMSFLGIMCHVGIDVGTNATATATMLKAGAKQAATGENSVVVACRKADVIIGPIGIVVADAMLGEVTPQMATAVGQADAIRMLLPVNKCDNIIVGMSEISVTDVLQDMLVKVKNIVELNVRL
jgi:MFS family permease